MQMSKFLAPSGTKCLKFHSKRYDKYPRPKKLGLPTGKNDFPSFLKLVSSIFKVGLPVEATHLRIPA